MDPRSPARAAARARRTGTLVPWLAAAALAGSVASCTGMIGEPSDPRRPPAPPPATCEAPDAAGADAAPAAPPREMNAARQLRRVYLALRGRPPLDAEFDELAQQTTEEARRAVITRAVDQGLASADFYRQMLDFGRAWLRTGAFLEGAQGDGYQGNMSGHLTRCGATTAHPGAYYQPREDARAVNACDDRDAMGNPASVPVREVEPWWAPGTRATLVGDAARENATVTVEGRAVDCGFSSVGYFNSGTREGCGCGPNAAWCYPGTGLGLGSDRAGYQRRDIWEEPSRLLAHLAWHDRSLADIVLGNYTVGNNRVRAWYLRFGRLTSLYNARLDGNTTWFRPDAPAGAPRDPEHPDALDPDAWREFVVEELAPQLLSLSGGARSGDPARTLRWDPRTETGPAPGLPAAGVFTMPGPNATFSRERPRAARYLEIFACREFNPPPPEQHFAPVGDDLARTGACQHCHALMDPVAMAFRRWMFLGGAYISVPHIADLADLRVPQDLYDERRAYTYSAWFRAGAARWRQNWLPNTTMTPVTEAQLAANLGAMFLDTIPPEYTVLGQRPDGTMGPLGFAKVLVASGEFDRCAVRRLYERFVGRPLDPGREARYIARLAEQFAQQGRQVRPFVRLLLETAEFRRGL